ncbi:MAG: hypothetical protein ACR2ID_02405 [Chthoniobacterales bacterium]
MQINRERKRLWIAIAASILVHLLVAFSLAAFNGISGPPRPLDDKPIELTVMDLSAVPTPADPVRKNPTYIETDPSRETKEEPAEKTFESNANSRAASMEPASGDLPLPSQEGKERPSMDLLTQNSSLPSQVSAPQPSPPPPTPVPRLPPTPTATPTSTPPPKPSETPKPTPLPEPVATPEPEKLAMLTSTQSPAFRAAEEVTASTPPEVTPTPPPATMRPRPPSAASAYQREQTQTRITGRLTDRGPSAVNAVGTPLGRYQKAVSDAIGERWYSYIKFKMDLVSVGTAVISAEVDPAGHVTNLRVVSNSANEAFANVCLQSFQEAKIAPIPPDLIPTLPDGRMQLEFSFTTYANR